MLFCAALSTRIYSIMGQYMGQVFDPCFLTHHFDAKSYKNHRFLGENGGFLVAEAGLEPTTSGL